MKMEESHVTGCAGSMGGKVKEDFSRIARDAQAQIKGQGEQVQGAADDLYDQARDAASGFTDVVRRTIEEQPYTAVAVALAVGWLLGRTHRPL
jgi:uncharacterized protein YjbJ (UPF0337 family)